MAHHPLRFPFMLFWDCISLGNVNLLRNSSFLVQCCFHYLSDQSRCLTISDISPNLDKWISTTNITSFQVLKCENVLTFSIRVFSSEAVIFPSPSQSNSLKACKWHFWVRKRLVWRVRMKAMDFPVSQIGKWVYLFKLLLGNCHFAVKEILILRG